VLGYNGTTPGIRTFCLTYQFANVLEGKMIGEIIQARWESMKPLGSQKDFKKLAKPYPTTRSSKSLGKVE